MDMPNEYEEYKSARQFIFLKSKNLKLGKIINMLKYFFVSLPLFKLS